MYPGYWAHGAGFAGPMWFIGPIFGLAWMALVIVGVFLVVRALRDRGSRQSTARDILDERYARGDLTTDEYHERLQHLRSN
jgi:putative membrane protein